MGPPIKTRLTVHVSFFYLYLKKIETILLRNTLKFCKGRKILGAQKLGIGRNTITRKIKELDIPKD